MSRIERSKDDARAWKGVKPLQISLLDQMSRLRSFLHSLVSGYVLLGTNAVYTLASVPLALHYLSNAEFGLWAITGQLGGYMALLDFGRGGSVSGILVEAVVDSSLQWALTAPEGA